MPSQISLLSFKHLVQQILSIPMFLLKKTNISQCNCQLWHLKSYCCYHTKFLKSKFLVKIFKSKFIVNSIIFWFLNFWRMTKGHREDLIKVNYASDLLLIKNILWNFFVRRNYANLGSIELDSVTAANINFSLLFLITFKKNGKFYSRNTFLQYNKLAEVLFTLLPANLAIYRYPPW